MFFCFESFSLIKCLEWFSTNSTKAKEIIDEFRLDNSVLHFQVFLIDENQNAYATDLICETNQIYTYEGQEIGSISSISSERKKPKRLDKSSVKINLILKKKFEIIFLFFFRKLETKIRRTKQPLNGSLPLKAHPVQFESGIFCFSKVLF